MHWLKFVWNSYNNSVKIKVEDLICLALRDNVLTNLSHLYQRVFAEAKERELFLEVFFLKMNTLP